MSLQVETNKKGKNWVGKSLKELKDKYGPAAGEAYAAELEKAGEYETNPLLPENKDLWLYNTYDGATCEYWPRLLMVLMPHN